MGLFDSIGGLLGGAAGFVGDIATGGAISNSRDQAAANQMNMQQAQNQMAFQERMSNSQWQRGVEDMRLAGLNPALAYTQGPASSPSGAAAQIVSKRSGDIGGGLGNTIKSAVGIGQQQHAVESQAVQNETQAEVNRVNADKLSANADEAREAAKREKMARQVDEAHLSANLKEGKTHKQVADIDNKLAIPDAVVERIKSILPFTRSNAKTYQTNHNEYYNTKP